MTSIYCAGKISKNDWRTIGYSTSGEHEPWARDSIHGWWPTTKNHIAGFDYTGPYAISCDHGCAHGEGTHGLGYNGDDIEGAYPAPHRVRIFDLCLEAIRRADVFFAWLPDEQHTRGDSWCEHVTAYGTLVEIGFALGIKKPIYIGTPNNPLDVVGYWAGHEHPHEWVEPRALDDVWFAFESATGVIVQPDPLSALKVLADQLLVRLDSPIEKAFWAAHLDAGYPGLKGLVTQREVQTPAGLFRLDFALPEIKVGIELDGYEYHSSKEQFTKDRARQRALEACGWRVIRFSGQEVYADAAHCVNEAAMLARQVRMQEQ